MSVKDDHFYFLEITKHGKENVMFREYNLEVHLHQNANRVLIELNNKIAILSISQTYLI